VETGYSIGMHDTVKSALPTILSANLLKGLPESVTSDFLRVLTVVRLPPRGVVFRAGDIGDRMFIVISGKVKVTRPSDDGKDNVFTIAGPGDLLGELSMFDGAARLATATAMRPTDVGWVANAATREWLERHPEASRRFMRILIDRIRRQNDALEDVYGLDVGTRVARAIVRLSGRFGRVTQDGIRVDLGMSQEELALHVRASRESVNQVFSVFYRNQWIRREGSDLMILDAPALARRTRYSGSVLPVRDAGESSPEV
jgi:CRP/FNR family cyclic AMP-dependent transcriptional regulator